MVEAIGKNTWSILLHHEFLIFAFQLIFLPLYNNGFVNDFSSTKLQQQYWYTYSPGDNSQLKIIYLIIGIVGSIGVSYVVKKGKDLSKRIIETIGSKI